MKDKEVIKAIGWWATFALVALGGWLINHTAFGAAVALGVAAAVWLTFVYTEL